MLEPLAQVLRAERERLGVIQLDIATQAGISRSMVARFETRQVVPEIGLDQLVSAYAAELEVEWLELWELAFAAARRT